MKNDYSSSLRMPMQWHESIQRFAERWNVSKSYVIRAAVHEFIKTKINQPK